MIKTNYTEEIIETLSEKHGLSKEVCKANIDYIINRTLSILEEEETVEFKTCAKLGTLHICAMILKNVKSNRHAKKEQREKKYEYLINLIKKGNLEYRIKKRFGSLPRLYRKFFNMGKKLTELQEYQNDYADKGRN